MLGLALALRRAWLYGESKRSGIIIAGELKRLEQNVSLSIAQMLFIHQTYFNLIMSA